MRVRREFEREQYRSELLVTVLQLLLAALLTGLYASTPPGFSPDAPIEAVPLGLMLFAVLASLRLYSCAGPNGTTDLQRVVGGVSHPVDLVMLASLP